MTFKHWITACILSAGLSTGAYAQQCADTVLFNEMETIADAMQTMGRSIRGNDLVTAQSVFPALQQAARNAHQEVPYSLRNGGSEQDIARFRSSIDDLNSLIDELELALNNTDQAAAAQALRAIGDARRDGHRQFKDRSCG